MLNEKNNIIIEAAMESEIELIVKSMDNARKTELLGYPVFEGSIGGCPVIAARNKVGMINAAILTKALIDRYKPLCLISEGTAGAYNGSLHTGDIVLGEKLYNINCINMSPEDCRQLEVISRSEWMSSRYYTSDPELISVASAVRYENGRVLSSAIGSADFWSFDLDSIRNIQKRFNTVCEDMESFAVAQTCTQMNVPCLCIRVISNNEPAGENFDENAALKGQNYTLDVVRAIIENYV